MEPGYVAEQMKAREEEEEGEKKGEGEEGEGSEERGSEQRESPRVASDRAGSTSVFVPAKSTVDTGGKSVNDDVYAYGYGESDGDGNEDNPWEGFDFRDFVPATTGEVYSRARSDKASAPAPAPAPANMRVDPATASTLYGNRGYLDAYGNSEPYDMGHTPVNPYEKLAATM
jgi:hypothetical protein